MTILGQIWNKLQRKEPLFSSSPLQCSGLQCQESKSFSISPLSPLYRRKHERINEKSQIKY